MRKTHNENLFADRGLDRFAKVSAELKAKKEKILSQMGANGADNIVVRFTYSNSLGWVPIVAELLGKEAKDGKNQKMKDENSAKRKHRTSADDHKLHESPTKLARKKPGLEIGPLLTPLILLLSLMLFGKTTAILCTALWWYLRDRFFTKTRVGAKESNKLCYIKKTKSEDVKRLLVDEESCIGRSILK